MTIKTWQLQTYGLQKSSSKREVYSNTTLPQETRKTSNKQPNFTPKTIGKRKTNKQTKKHQIDNLTLHLKQLEKEEQQQKNPQN